MRIGLVIYGDLDTRSGGYLYDRMLVEHLQRQGDEVSVISLPWRNYARHLTDNTLVWLERRLASLKVDLLLQDELNHPSLFEVNRGLRRRGCPPVITIVHHLRSSEPHPALLRRLYAMVERRYLDSVDGFVFNSQTTRQVVQAIAGSDRPGVVAYPAGDRLAASITDSEIVARSRIQGPLRLLFLGNVITRKGLHVLLESVVRLPAGSWALTVAGDLRVEPGYARHQRRKVHERRLAGSIRFTGPLGREAVGAAMNDHHVLVVPSLYEGFGIVYLEAMGFGLPAVGTTAGAAGEIITHGKDGFLVPREDPLSLAACLQELVFDRQRLADMALAARRRFARHPTWSQTGGRIREFLQQFPSQQGRKV